MGHVTMSSVIVVTCNAEPTENYHLKLQFSSGSTVCFNVFGIIVSVLQPTTDSHGLTTLVSVVFRCSMQLILAKNQNK